MLADALGPGGTAAARTRARPRRASSPSAASVVGGQVQAPQRVRAPPARSPHRNCRRRAPPGSASACRARSRRPAADPVARPRSARNRPAAAPPGGSGPRDSGTPATSPTRSMTPGGRCQNRSSSRQIDELKRRLQLVIAVRATPDDVQEQVQLAGCRPGLRPPQRADGSRWRTARRRELPVVEHELQAHVRTRSPSTAWAPSAPPNRANSS